MELLHNVCRINTRCERSGFNGVQMEEKESDSCLCSDPLRRSLGTGLLQECEPGIRTRPDAVGAGRLGVGELRERRHRHAHLQPQHAGTSPSLRLSIPNLYHNLPTVPLLGLCLIHEDIPRRSNEQNSKVKGELSHLMWRRPDRRA